MLPTTFRTRKNHPYRWLFQSLRRLLHIVCLMMLIMAGCTDTIFEPLSPFDNSSTADPMNQQWIDAENADELCQVLEDEGVAIRSISENCIDTNTVLDECKKIYVRTNFHFFLGDDCSADNLPALMPSGTNLYRRAQNFLADANRAMGDNRDQWNAEAWGAPFKPARCNPFRYLLTGVYIHCNSQAQTSGRNLTWLRDNFGVNLESEINVFVSTISGGTTGMAFRNGNALVIDWLNTGNFNHEMGHIFDLSHAHLPLDYCDDTPAILYDYDKDCDGVLSYGERNRQCWSHVPENSDACLPTGNCEPSPCCDAKYVNNNVMAYNAYQRAFTECQLQRMLSSAVSTHCNRLVVPDNDCAPPSAFMDIHPAEIANAWDCVLTMRMEGSVNDSYYKLEVLENGLPHSSTGWRNGPATTYELELSRKASSRGIAESDSEKRNFTAILTVQNPCGDEDVFTLAFSIPHKECMVKESPEIPKTHVLPGDN